MFNSVKNQILINLMKNKAKRKKTNVKYEKILYYPNYENQCVRCELHYSINLNKWPFIGGINIPNNDIIRIAKKLGAIKITRDLKTGYPSKVYFVSVATSQCSEGDIFDVILGRRISLTRCQGKAFEHTCKFYDFYHEIVEQYADQLITAINNSYEAGKKCWTHVDDMLNDYDNMLNAKANVPN